MNPAWQAQWTTELVIPKLTVPIVVELLKDLVPAGLEFVVIVSWLEKRWKIDIHDFFIVEYTCGKTTMENGTYFSNPATPARICNLLINRINDDICQVVIFLIYFFHENQQKIWIFALKMYEKF